MMLGVWMILPVMSVGFSVICHHWQWGNIPCSCKGHDDWSPQSVRHSSFSINIHNRSLSLYLLSEKWASSFLASFTQNFRCIISFGTVIRFISSFFVKLICIIVITQFCMDNLFMFLVGAVNNNQPLLYSSLLKCFPWIFLIGAGLSFSLFSDVLVSILFSPRLLLPVSVRPSLVESRIISVDTFMFHVNSVDIRHHWW